MKSQAANMKLALLLTIGAILAAGPAMADKPAWAGAGKSGKDERVERRDEQGRDRRADEAKSRRDGPATAKSGHFEERQRTIVREYYAEQFRAGRCPPGLAKKHNGCMPPGQAKNWQIGHPLPRDLKFYDLPQPLIVRIGPPPPGHRYVRVATDILLVAIGTQIVVDAIQDLGR